jgi:CRISPR-associated protein Cst2
MTTQLIYSLSICGRVTLDMHSLNNEGGEGNQITTRMVTIVHKDAGEPKLATVNAISGDMFKHIQAEHLYRLAKGRLPLCAGCQTFSASRILDDREFMGDLPKQDGQVIDALLKRCALDDLEGNLIAKNNRSVPRKSVAEFGWVVGLPEVTRTESYFHVRYATERGGDEKASQPIFHRPASSGVYAVVVNLEIARIGFNDITQKYAVDDEERARRTKAFLESILYTFIEPNGAMRGTQNPHILGFEGAVTVSTKIMPAPALSALEGSYVSELRRVADALNRIAPGALTVHEFATMGAFAEVMQTIIADSTPYKMAECTEEDKAEPKKGKRG